MNLSDVAVEYGTASKGKYYINVKGSLTSEMEVVVSPVCPLNSVQTGKVDMQYKLARPFSDSNHETWHTVSHIVIGRRLKTLNIYSAATRVPL